MQKGSQKAFFSNPSMIKANAPRWLEGFICAAGDCPDTCCKGWNIEIDAEHAALYSQLTDSDLSSRVPQIIHKLRIKKNGRTIERSFLNILAQTDQKCLFLTEQQRCMIQEKMGVYALCETCALFPRELWQEDRRWFMSASLCCPEIRKRALTCSEPFDVRQLQTAEDSQCEWLETSLIQNASARKLFRNRFALIQILNAQLECRTQTLRQNLEQCFQWLLNLPALSEMSLPPKISNTETITQLRVQNAEDICACFDIVNKILNWDGQKASKPLMATRILSNEMIAGNVLPLESMANNYLNAASAYIDPFLANNRLLLENFYKHYFFSHFMKQFNDVMNEQIPSEDVIHYELCQLIVINTLLMQSLTVRAIRNQALLTAHFLEAVGFVAKHFLHYPEYLNRSIRGYLAQHGFDENIYKFIRI